MKNGTRYSVVLPPPVEKDLEQLSSKFGISKADVFKSSLTFLKRASEAKKVQLCEVTKDGTEVTRDVLFE